MLSNNIPTIEKALKRNRARRVFSRHWSKRSAVVALLDAEHISEASLLLIQRAKREGDPWSGHMAFPGGRYERGDRTGWGTAKREMAEEVGFDADAPEHQLLNAKLAGRLSDYNTTKRVLPTKMVISAYVMTVDEQPRLHPNYEVADTIWLPMSYFSDFTNRDMMDFKFRGKDERLPCYRVSDEKVIWGITLTLIDELLIAHGVEIPHEKRNPRPD